MVAVNGLTAVRLRLVAEVDAEDERDGRHAGRQENIVRILEQIVDAAAAEQEEHGAPEPQKAFHTVTAFHQWYFSPRLILNAR